VDRIEPIRPRLPGAQPIPAIRRTKRSEEEREQPGSGARREHPGDAPPEDPPDDGQPHVDVRV
jgi:hypothetical protein